MQLELKLYVPGSRYKETKSFNTKYGFRMKNFIFFILAFHYQAFLFAWPPTQTEIYLWQEHQCMVPYHYEAPNGNGFTDYHLSLGENQKAIFRLNENALQRPQLLEEAPAGVRTCVERAFIGPVFAQEVNSGSKTFFLVERVGQSVALRRVDEVILLQTTDQGVRYEGAFAAFAYHFGKQYDVAEDLRLNQEVGGTIFFTNQDQIDCHTVLSFRAYGESYDQYTDFTIVPGIGLWQVTRDATAYQLLTIDGEGATAWLAKACAPAKPTLSPVTEYGFSPKGIEAPSKRVAMPVVLPSPPTAEPQGARPGAWVAAPPDTTLPAVTRYHIVKTGESLYAISQRYGLTKARLMELNQLHSDRIYSLQRLLVVDDNPPKEQPYRYDALGKPHRYHIVRQGDYLFKLAQYYHTTVEKLIELNHLNSIELVVEQVLYVD